MPRNCKILIYLLVVISSIHITSSQEPEYKNVILDGKPAKLNVKTGKITLVSSNGNKPAAPKIVPKGENNVSNTGANTSDFHTVKANERLVDIANAYNITLTKLIKGNHMESTLIKEGQQLRIRNFSDYKPPSKAPKISTYSNNSGLHTVSTGETLYSISERYGIAVQKLKSINGLSSNLIRVGQKLKVDISESSPTVSSSDTWIVAKGDTLYNIAKRNGISVDVLKRINKLSGNVIKVGQELRLK